MSQRVPVEKKVMVLGDTPEAGRVAHDLLGLGYLVHWVSFEDTPIRTSLADPRLAFYGDCNLVALEGDVGQFTARLRRDGEMLSLDAAALVVATGNERYYPSERYKLSLSSNVLTVSQIQRQLDAVRGAGAARILVMLDLGGETAKETATETLRLAIRLREEWRGEVYAFYQNLKVDTPGYERLTREMREKGVVFCRYAEPQITVDEKGIAVAYVEGTVRGELLVLPEAVRPREGTAELAALLRVRVGEDGYFQDINIHHYRPGLSVRKGIYFAGRCHLDVAGDEALSDAALAAANIDALLGEGFLEPEAVIAHVDSYKCIRCLTCIRTCPHAAVELADYQAVTDGDGLPVRSAVTAARVVDLACRGCGACLANCPVRAIELVGQQLPAWMLAKDNPQEISQP
jgi:heterodisulfide reductase subunit A-like polyferredoxin